MRGSERVLLTLVLLAAVAAVFWFAVPLIAEPFLTAAARVGGALP